MAEKIRVGLAVFGLGVLSIIAVELIARLGAVLYEEFVQRQEYFDTRAKSPAYGPGDETPGLYAELRESMIREYRPYVGWSRRPYQGTRVNVDEEGDRVTHNNSDREDALSVWVFGGSTVWGFGVPNSQTMPSYLSASFNEEWGVDTTVRNMGESAFVSTQELARLIAELQLGRRPDVVVIYDGINDAYAGTYSPGVPGAIHNQDQISSRVENRDIWGNWIRSLGLFRAIDFVLRKIGLDSNIALSQANAVENSVLKQRAQDTADIWFQNSRVVAALGEAYGFDVISALQPNLFIRGKPLQPHEREILKGTEKSEPVLAEGTRLTYEAIQASLDSEDYKQIVDLTGAFNNIPSSLYVDEIHVVGQGNKRLAQLLFDTARMRLCEDIPGHASQHARGQILAQCAGS